MKDYQAKNIRNLSIVGHGSEGKTTLVEALLFTAGAIDRQGRVEDGSTTTDHEAEETRRQISISAARIVRERIRWFIPRDISRAGNTTASQ
jgi:elongation factor G